MKDKNEKTTAETCEETTAEAAEETTETVEEEVPADAAQAELDACRAELESRTAELAAEKLIDKFPSLNIVGTHHGYFDKDEEIISDIKQKSPDLLIVCLGSPRQEIWVHRNKEKLSGVGAVMCLGGVLDVWSGNIKRAPSFFIKLHLEWLWRMLLEPKRMKELPKMIKFRILTGKSCQNQKSFK
jgi:exopolysaccharide biosynthesis WecB/TagA/CpsF family protein